MLLWEGNLCMLRALFDSHTMGMPRHVPLWVCSNILGVLTRPTSPLIGGKNVNRPITRNWYTYPHTCFALNVFFGRDIAEQEMIGSLALLAPKAPEIFWPRAPKLIRGRWLIGGIVGNSYLVTSCLFFSSCFTAKFAILILAYVSFRKEVGWSLRS